MQIVDTGVLPPSFMDFSLPSEFAKSAVRLPQAALLLVSGQG